MKRSRQKTAGCAGALIGNPSSPSTLQDREYLFLRNGKTGLHEMSVQEGLYCKCRTG